MNYVTTGSNRVVFNVASGQFCNGLEMEWSKSPSFPSGSTTQSQVVNGSPFACNSASLSPLTSYVGYTQYIGSAGTSSWSDDGKYWVRWRRLNYISPTFYPPFPTSSYSAPIQITTNPSQSCLSSGQINYVTTGFQNGGAQFGSASIWIPSQYNSSSNVWWNAAQDQPQYFPTTASINTTFGTPYVAKSGSTQGNSLNSDGLVLNGAQLTFDMAFTLTGSNQMNYGVCAAISTGSYIVSSSKWRMDLDTNGTRLFVEGLNGTNTTITGSFYNSLISIAPRPYIVGPSQNMAVYQNGTQIGSFTILINQGGDRFITLSGSADCKIQMLGFRFDSSFDSLVPISQSNTYNCIFNS